MSNGVKKHKNNGEKMNVKDYIVVFFVMLSGSEVKMSTSKRYSQEYPMIKK